tara:strand:- start:30 stop:479 length:450 start_codon:yes stop_codon:yes gene_type:complete
VNADTLKKITDKVPAFRDLTTRQLHGMIQAGETIVPEPGTVLCKEAETSTDMFIPLSGELSGETNNLQLMAVKTSDVVGEMSLITGLPRSATIKVVREATLFVVHKEQFDNLMRENVDLAVKVYRNMLLSLCSKLRDTNIHLVASNLGV